MNRRLTQVGTFSNLHQNLFKSGYIKRRHNKN